MDLNFKKTEYKKQAKMLKGFLKEKGFNVPHVTCLNAIALIHGRRNWNVLEAESFIEEPNGCTFRLDETWAYKTDALDFLISME